jgi:hypothetical protein
MADREVRNLRVGDREVDAAVQVCCGVSETRCLGVA